MFLIKAFTEHKCFQKSADLEEVAYDPVIHLLQQLRINTLLFQDSKGNLAHEIAKRILEWSDENQPVRKKAEELYKQLYKCNRFIKVNELSESDINNLEKVVEVLKYKGLVAIITKEPFVMPKQHSYIESVELKKLSQSMLIEKIENQQEFEITGLLKNRDLFKEEVLKEIVENSNNEIEVYDRHVGTAGFHEDELAANYKESLELLIEAFLEYTKDTRDIIERKFILTTGVKYSGYNQRAMETAFKKLMIPFKNEKKFKYEIYVKKEIKEKEMKHARYLFSSVFDYKFEHGFGFIEKFDRNRIHNLEISLILKEKAKKIKKQFDELNLKTIVEIKN